MVTPGSLMTCHEGSLPVRIAPLQADIILGAMRLHLGYALNDRSVGEILRERGMLVDHTTVFRANRTDGLLTPVDDFRHPPPTPLSA
jgi:hypothetical protein